MRNALTLWNRTPNQNAFDWPFQSELDSLFTPRTAASVRHNTYLPACEIIESKNSFSINLDLPGMAKDEIKIEYEKGTLTISGARKANTINAEEEMIRNETRYGEFSRSFKLPESVDSDHIHAEHANGVLKLSIPKKEAAKPKLIDIKVA